MTTPNKTKEEVLAEIIKNKEETLSRHQNFDALKDGITEKFVLNSLNLKDRQQESVLTLTDTPKGDYTLSKGYFHACTAFGKTYLMMAMAEGYNHIQPNKKIIILEESTKVLEQVKQDFATKTEQFDETSIGAFYGNEKITDTPVIISTYASMKKMIEKVGLENIGLVLCDEAHHILSENRQQVAHSFNNACLYGFTATPDYDEDKDCAKVFENIIDQVTLLQGVNNKLLCSFKNSLIISKTAVDLTNAKNSSGDYDAKKLSEILKQSHLTGIREEIADFYLYGEDKTLGKLVGKTTIINTPNQEEAEELAKVFNLKAGYDIAKAYHSNTDDSVLEDFNQNKFPVLIQVNRVSEGYSNPNAEICFNYPTASKVRSAQCGGRVLRWNKENPDKIALIVDICFKKSNNLSPLEEIRQNGQVLFMDIAQDTAIIHKDLEEKLEKTPHTHSNTSKEKKVFSNYELFDIVTDMEELYNMRFDQMLSDEENAPKRERLSTDLGWTEFLYNTPLAQNGKTISAGIKQKRKSIWENAFKEHPEFFIKVKSGSYTLDMIPKENMEQFKTYLKTFGIEITNYREKLETDLGWSKFLNNTPLAQNGKTIPLKEEDKEQKRKSIWKNAFKKHPEFFVKVKAGRNTIDVISEENIDTFKAYLKTFGIEITNYREKLSTDLGWNEFLYNTPLAQNGKTISTGTHDKEQKRKAIWENAFKEHPEFFIKVKAGFQTKDIIPEQNLDAFKAYLKTFGIEITNYREKLETDLGWTEFNITPLAQNGKTIPTQGGDKEQKRKAIWEKTLKKHPEFFIKTKATSVIPEQNLDAFKAYLKTFGIEITNYREKLATDLGWNDFLKKTPLAQNGKTIPASSKDKEEKRKTIWEKALEEHPEFFIKVKSGSNTADIIPEEKLDNFIAYLNKKGISLKIPKEELLKKISPKNSTPPFAPPTNGGM